MTCRSTAFASLLLVAIACGGSLASMPSEDAGAGSDSGSSPESGVGTGDSAGSVGFDVDASGCGDMGGSSTGGGGGGNLDFCAGPIICGAGVVCTPPQTCCIPQKTTGGPSPPTCPCGVSTVQVGTKCAGSCPTGEQACFQNPSGQDFDCPQGQNCLLFGDLGTDDVQVPLAFCAPSGANESSSSSSGGGGAGTCVGPNESCAGAAFQCSSALSCSQGQVCCIVTAQICQTCPTSSTGSSSSGG
jgi:hypothetical protein